VIDQNNYTQIRFNVLDEKLGNHFCRFLKLTFFSCRVSLCKRLIVLEADSLEDFMSYFKDVISLLILRSIFEARFKVKPYFLYEVGATLFLWQLCLTEVYTNRTLSKK
jgi:hypothetical protein